MSASPNLPTTSSDAGEGNSSSYLLSQASTLEKFVHKKKVGHYLIGRKMGSGNFGKVCESLNSLAGEKVAIKIINKKQAEKDNYVRKNLRREGSILQCVRHPNVIQLYEVLETENHYYLVMELCEGGNLVDYVIRRKGLEELEVRRYLRQILSGVDYLHRGQILHRDLKVDNILLTASNNVKIIDFGLSNTLQGLNAEKTSSDGQTGTRKFCSTHCGSPAYASPEVLASNHYGTEVDVWSCGVTLFAMVTGYLPFTVEPFDIKVLHRKMIQGKMNPFPLSVSQGCVELVKKFLNPDPTKRITIEEAMRDKWLNKGFRETVETVTFPNYLKQCEINTDILDHMQDNLSIRKENVVKALVSNRSIHATAMYHLFCKKLSRYTTKKHSIYDGEMQNKPATQKGVLRAKNETELAHFDSQIDGYIARQNSPVPEEITASPVECPKCRVGLPQIHCKKITGKNFRDSVNQKEKAIEDRMPKIQSSTSENTSGTGSGKNSVSPENRVNKKSIKYVQSNNTRNRLPSSYNIINKMPLIKLDPGEKSDGVKIVMTTRSLDRRSSEILQERNPPKRPVVNLSLLCDEPASFLKRFPEVRLSGRPSSGDYDKSLNQMRSLLISKQHDRARLIQQGKSGRKDTVKPRNLAGIRFRYQKQARDELENRNEKPENNQSKPTEVLHSDSLHQTAFTFPEIGPPIFK